MTIFNSELEDILKEDIQYGDLSTKALNIENQQASMSFTCRAEFMVSSCIDEAARMCKMLDLSVISKVDDAVILSKGQSLLEVTGDASNIHKAWKSVQNLIDYACGVATYTKKLVEKAHKTNPDIVVATTRKTPPYLKKIALKSIKNGGAIAHRLNLSETILIFNHHREFLQDIDLKERIKEVKKNNPEKQIIIEAKTYEEALMFAQMDVNVIQLDKFELDELNRCANELKSKYPNIKIIATGGINVTNIEQYCSKNIEMIVTSSPYFAPPADVKVGIKKI